ncbi:4-aminobutyrate transaminase, partial [Cryomyces antarcticus]
LPRPPVRQSVDNPQQAHPQARHPRLRLAAGVVSSAQVPARGTRRGERARGAALPRRDREAHQDLAATACGRRRRAHPVRRRRQPRIARLLQGSPRADPQAQHPLDRRRGADGRRRDRQVLGARALEPGRPAGHGHIQQEGPDGGLLLRQRRAAAQQAVPPVQHVDGRPGTRHPLPRHHPRDRAARPR